RAFHVTGVQTCALPVLADLEKVNANARQAVLMAEQAAQAGDHAKAAEYTATAESFANRLIALEREVEDLKALHLQSTEAANQARSEERRVGTGRRGTGE